MLETERVRDGYEIWRRLPTGRRVTVIDHATQQPVVVSKRDIHAANYGASNLAQRIAQILGRD